MYCSACGAAAPPNVSYCSRCGAKAGAAKGEGSDKPAEVDPDSLVWAIVAVFVVGLGTTIGLLAVMKEVVGFNLHVILAVTALCFLMMLTVEGVFISLLLSRRKGAKEAGGAGRPKEQTTQELGEAQARMLPEPVPSVTEHATRAFEPLRRERSSK